MASQLPTAPPERFTHEQLAELRSSLDRANAERRLPRLPEWYRDLPVIERGLAITLSRITGR